MALANQELFELFGRPLVKLLAVLLSFMEITQEPGQVERPTFCLNLVKFELFHLTTTWFLGSFGE